MDKTTFDPGLTQQYTGEIRRSINQDGSFNVHRRGGSWRDFHPYLLLLTISWRQFFLIVLSLYVVTNLLFASAFFALGPGALQGDEAPTEAGRFLNDFFFSTQTLTTVGYGGIHPKTVAANALASLEALIGLMSFALGTGLLFGRFSKPSARIAFSEALVVAPYQERTSLQLRVANMRPNVLLDLHATVLLMTVEGPAGNQKRRYQELKLERSQINFLPLTWTIVHPIEESSPLHGVSAKDLRDLRAEFLVLVRAFDDTFSQSVNGRYSYRHDEVVWQARFEPAFEVARDGAMVLHLDRVSRHTRLGG